MSFVRAAPRSRKAPTPTPVNSHVDKSPIGEVLSDENWSLSEDAPRDPLMSDEEDADYEPSSSDPSGVDDEENWSLSE
jgi:hypothetical protein